MCKRERKRKKYMMRTENMWNREKKKDTKVKRAGRENIKQRLTGTTSLRPS